jgi:4-hydroxy-tetrahydrodipicolinate synthase
MRTDNWRGIFCILQTPFDDTGDLIWEDFEREVDFIARSGAHGFVWPVMASEFTVIAAHERIRGMRLAVDVVAGRIPVVIGVADTSKAGAVHFAQEAARSGADGIISLPPWATKLSSHTLFADYYQALADASRLPVIIQNTGGPLGSGLPADFIVDLCEQFPLVQYVKEEKSPQGHSVSEVIDVGSAHVAGVFSGASARFILSEHKRGVCGNMPACVLPDVDAQIWDLLEAGREEDARHIHNAKVVFENCMGNMPYRARKEVLRRRGILSSTASRSVGPLLLDLYEMDEFDYAMSLVEPYFTV